MGKDGQIYGQLVGLHRKLKAALSFEPPWLGLCFGSSCLCEPCLLFAVFVVLFAVLLFAGLFVVLFAVLFVVFG